MLKIGSTPPGATRWGLALVALAPTLVLLTAPRAEAYCDRQGKNLRIFQMNVHGLPPRPGDPDGNADIYGVDDATRMKAIADEILDDDPDVVILEEVWQGDDGGKQMFEDKLTPRYPFQVQYVRGFYYLFDLTNSGLMLFSKDPFIPFSKDVEDDASVDACAPATAGSNGKCMSWGPSHANNEIAVRTYRGPFECTGSDCNSAKAVAMVRMHGACDYAVAWTHTDADWSVQGERPKFDQLARANQFGAIEWLITSSLTPNELDHTPIFFAGDLNVDGNVSHDGLSGPGQEFGLLPSLWDATGSSLEYNVQFTGTDVASTPFGSFFDCRQPEASGLCNPSTSGGKLFTDSWHYETSPQDIGQTNHGTINGFDFDFGTKVPDLNAGGGLHDQNLGYRLDYIFHSNPISEGSGTQFLCMQHITRDWRLTNPARSDHMALRADFNGMAPRCNAVRKGNPMGGPANGAEPVKFDAKGNSPYWGSDGVTTLTWPGSNQWYIVDDPGTFSLFIEDPKDPGKPHPKIGAAIYHHSDLSREKVSFHGEFNSWQLPNEQGSMAAAPKYTFDDPPYYIRVYGMQDATVTPGRCIQDPGTACVGDVDCTSAGDTCSTQNYHRADRAYPATGAENYNIFFHMSKCVSAKDSCSLPAGSPAPQHWPAQALNADDMAYWTFDADAISTTSFPRISFRFEPQASQGGTVIPSSSVFDKNRVRYFPSSYADGTPDCFANGNLAPCNADIAVGSSWSNWTDTNKNSFDETTLTVRDGSFPPSWVGTPTKYFLKLGRPAAYVGTAFDETIQYETTVTYFKPLTMVCHVQQSYLGDDQIGLDMRFDTGAIRQDCDKASCPGLASSGFGPQRYVGQFDDGGAPRPLSGLGFEGRFTQFALPSLYEDVRASSFEYLIFANDQDQTLKFESNATSGCGLISDPEDCYAKIWPLVSISGGDQGGEANKRVFYWCGDEGGSNVSASKSISKSCKDDPEFQYTMEFILSHDPQILH